MSSELVEKASELQDLRLEYQRLLEAYRRILPKVDPDLIDDFDADRKTIHPSCLNQLDFDCRLMQYLHDSAQ